MFSTEAFPDHATFSDFGLISWQEGVKFKIYMTVTNKVIVTHNLFFMRLR